MNSDYMPGARQHGAALLVGLVLMMVLTILAISTMRTATVELAMAGNARYHEKARQLAEAGLVDGLGRINQPGGIVPDANNPGNWLPTGVVGDLGDGTGDTYTLDIRYLNSGMAPISYSQGDNAVRAHFFELRSTGRTAARNARSVLVQGFFVLL